ncbi:MAG: phage tail tape measure protein [Phycisphaeraceae bacterium]|nr:MAG: phage tail tape measure protein [Phycisphaeraceae bacterium]
MPNPRGIRAGRAFVELGVSDRLSAGLRRAQRRLRAFGAGVRAVGTRLVAAGGAALAAFAPMVRVFARAGDELDKMSRRTGISVESLSELGFAAEQSGADLGTLEKGVRTLQRSIIDLERGLSTQTDAFSALGLSINDLRDLAPEEQFKLVAERLSNIEDPTRRAAVAMQILGRAGSQLLPLMQEGARGIEAMQEEARRLGLTISTETARDAARFTDAMNILRRVLRITAVAIGAALAPALEALVERVTRIAVVTNDWIRQNRQLIVTAAKIAVGVVAVGAALLALGVAITLIGAAFGGLATIVSAVGGAFGLVGAVLGALLSPIGLVVAAVVGAGVAFLRFGGSGSAALEFLRDRFASLGAVVGRTLGGIRDALAAGDLALAARVLWNGLRLVFLEGTREIRETFTEGLLVMRLAFVDVLGGMSRLWTRFASGVQGVWERTQNFLAKRFTELFGLFDESLDVEAAKAQLDARSRSALESLARETEDALGRISREQDERTRGILDGAAEKMEERRRALEDARRELDRALDESRRRREQVEADDAGRPPVLDRFRDLIAELDSVGEGIARRVEVRGTFNPALIQRLLGAGGTGPADRTAKASEETARNTRRLLESAQQGGLTFT